MKVPVLVLLALWAVPEVLLAQTMVPKLDEPGHRGDLARKAYQRSVAQFDGADADKDSRLSKAEVSKTSQYLNDNFAKLDANRDGYLSWEEFLGHDRWPR